MIYEDLRQMTCLRSQEASGKRQNLSLSSSKLSL